jgi:hypothetical protein
VAKPKKPKNKPAPNKPPRAKPKTIKSKAKPKTKKKKVSKPAYKMLDLHFDNVAANIPLGIERSMDTCLNMFRYELPRDYQRMQVEAKQALDGKVGQVLALAHARGLTMLDTPAIEAMLREVATDEVERYASMEE